MTATFFLDSDGDGVSDADDACNNTAPGAAIDEQGCADSQVDSDGDGVADVSDTFPSDPDEWADTDSDGVGDNRDAFPSDPNEWADADSDGMGDNGDALPSDPAASVDSDGDGFPDEWNAGKSQVDSTTGLYLDLFPSDPDEWTDTDGDGVGDNGDAFPSDPEEWADTDGDGVGDNGDAFPETAWLRAWWQMGLILLVLVASGAAASYRYSQYTLARRVSGKVDELRAKIAEFKEKGINTDELERVLAECEAEMGAATESEE